MGIFDRAPVTITVYPSVFVDDGYGGTKPGEGTPVTVQVVAQPMSPDDPDGWTQPRRYKLLGKDFPAGPWSRVTMFDREWSVVSPPLSRAYSRRTRFYTAEVIERGDS
ncbi:head-to-tail connector complex protein [Streptomyces phage Shaeky]|uniref:Head-to-tail connector complex protein n=1 Tax=Streptomyces phage Shaeky TaxID=2767586 RepID=A0A873WVN5_9CAUD|nr:head-to-tail connector complex protein [Streptomyces phage Shaeky]